MLHLTKVIDRATGYVFTPKGSAYGDAYAMFTTAAGPLQGVGADVHAVQERWVDHRAEYDEFERSQWQREGEAVRATRDRAGRTEAKGADHLKGVRLRNSPSSSNPNVEG